MLTQRHNQYPTEQLAKAEFQDDPLPLRDGSSTTLAEMSVFGYRTQIESSQVAIQVWCGWMDADVCEGALSRYLTFKNPQQVIIGPFSHGLEFNADPFLTPSQHSPPEPAVEQQYRMMADFFDGLLRPEVSSPIESGIRYYTMGEGQWHQTKGLATTGIRLYNPAVLRGESYSEFNATCGSLRRRRLSSKLCSINRQEQSLGDGTKPRHSLP